MNKKTLFITMAAIVAVFAVTSAAVVVALPTSVYAFNDQSDNNNLHRTSRSSSQHQDQDNRGNN